MAWDSKPVWPEKYPQETNPAPFRKLCTRLASPGQGSGTEVRVCKCVKAGILWRERVADVSVRVCARGSECALLRSRWVWSGRQGGLGDLLPPPH